ncbi:MAG: modulator protein [Herpetosiphonaceae bacterium]|nr:MAG: modulator protein [Herpetosiphonaceae bacterium]
MQTILKTITRRLREHPEIADWSLQRAELRSTQRYLIGNITESRRNVERVVYPLTIYHDHEGPDGEPSRGVAGVTILADGSNLEAALDEAVLMASLVNNRPYSLPGPAVYPDVPIAAAAILERPVEVADELLVRLRAAVEREPDVRLSSAEVFLEERRTTLYNSRGVKAEALGTSLLLDFVLLAGQGANEMESHIAVERRRLEDLDIEALVARQAGYARDALRTTTPRTGRGAVVLRDEALVDLLGNYESEGVLAFHTSARAKYLELSRLEEGELVTLGRPIVGDRLTYTGTRRLPFGLHSGPFDGDGLPAEEIEVIRDGVLQRRWASQRYADYLGLAPTGAFGNALVPAGQASFDELLQEARVQIVSFSWMNPDTVTGDFVAEIRLGYERDGDVWRPIRGGSLSGNLFAALADVRFSRETGFFGHYQGPVAARFGELTISGS